MRYATIEYYSSVRFFVAHFESNRVKLYAYRLAHVERKREVIYDKTCADCICTRIVWDFIIHTPHTWIYSYILSWTIHKLFYRLSATVKSSDCYIDITKERRKYERFVFFSDMHDSFSVSIRWTYTIPYISDWNDFSGSIDTTWHAFVVDQNGICVYIIYIQ